MTTETLRDWAFGIERGTAPSYGRFVISFAKWRWEISIKKRTEHEMAYGFVIFYDYGWKWQILHGSDYWGN
jgi:hypothetical protein